MNDLVLKTYSYRVKDATSGTRLTTLGDAVNTVWNYVNESRTRSASRGAVLRYKCGHAGVAYGEVYDANTTRT